MVVRVLQVVGMEERKVWQVSEDVEGMVVEGNVEERVLGVV